MNEHIIGAVRNFLSSRGVADANDMEVVVVNSTNGASANSQRLPRLLNVRVTTRTVVPKRKFEKRLTDEECLRAVEEGGVKGKDACHICLDEEMKQPVQLIHFEKKKGDGKANFCKTAMCFSCLQGCIKSQKPQDRGLIRPQCPCCRGNIYKAVPLSEPNVVLNLPAFQPLTYDVLLRDAARLSLTFGYDRIRREAGGWNITKWAIQTPVESRAKMYMHVSRSNSWNALFKNAGSTMFRSQFQNFPEQREIMEALKRKIGKLKELSNLPSVYRLTLEDYLVEQKTKAELSTVVDLTDSPKKKKRKKAKKESAGCCGSCSKPSSS